MCDVCVCCVLFAVCVCVRVHVLYVCVSMILTFLLSQFPGFCVYVCVCVCVWVFTILSSIVQGVLVSGRIEEPYGLDVGRKCSLSMQILTYCSPIEKLRLGEESDRWEQNVNKDLLANSAAYFGLKSVIDA